MKQRPELFQRKISAVLSILALGLLSLHAAKPPTSEVNTTGLAVTDDTVTVGQLHSATGTMAISETGSIEAEQLAIDQINASGGVLGR
jgi:urea transport system substrate-binding protein